MTAHSCNPGSRKWFIIYACIALVGMASASGCTLNRMLNTPSQTPVIELSPIPAQPTVSPTLEPSSTVPPATLEITPIPTAPASDQKSDRILLSLAQSGHKHLYVYQPLKQPITQITSGDWDDRDPVVSPDGSKIAFASNRGGFWDLYLLDLLTQQTIPLTNTPAYDDSPSWSPDGQWIAFETYNGSHFDIIVLPVNDPTLPSIQLTQDSGNNFSPSWSPAGREVAFVTDRSGANEIWVANLDKIDERFRKIIGATGISYTSPLWSPDGSMLAWTKTLLGVSTVESAQDIGGVWVIQSFGKGSQPVWSPDGSSLLLQISQPNATYLIGVAAANGLLLFPAEPVPSAIHGVDWHIVDLAGIQQMIATAQAEGAQALSLWQPVITGSVGLNNRKSLVQLAGVKAAYPYLVDTIDESFTTLRDAAGKRLGWDFLSILDDAVLPISAPPQPGISENWLYTGRAINVNSTPLEAGWMIVTREDYEGQVYWRIWVRCVNQDGSCGEPQRIPSWDFSARYQGDGHSYEEGGRTGTTPEGYWVDFTNLALTHGWERMASLSNWRAYFQATLFNQFVFRQGINWADAMSELYPADIIQGSGNKIPLPIEP